VKKHRRCAGGTARSILQCCHLNRLQTSFKLSFIISHGRRLYIAGCWRLRHSRGSVTIQKCGSDKSRDEFARQPEPCDYYKLFITRGKAGSVRPHPSVVSCSVLPLQSDIIHRSHDREVTTQAACVGTPFDVTLEPPRRQYVSN